MYWVVPQIAMNGRARIGGWQDVFDQRDKIRAADASNWFTRIAPHIEKNLVLREPQVLQHRCLELLRFVLVFVGFALLAQHLRQPGHGFVFAKLKGAKVHGKNRVAVLGIVGEGDVVVLSGLDGSFPKEELPLRVVLRFFTVGDNLPKVFPHWRNPLNIAGALGSQQGPLSEKGLYGEPAHRRSYLFERWQTLHEDEAWNISLLVDAAGESQNPSFQVLRIFAVLVRQVRPDEKSIPVPHLFVISAGNQVVVFEVALRGTNGLRFELGVGCGHASKQQAQVVGRFCLGRGKTREKKS
jgi:hypothetical protein